MVGKFWGYRWALVNAGITGLLVILNIAIATSTSNVFYAFLAVIWLACTVMYTLVYKWSKESWEYRKRAYEGRQW